ncbi:MAG: hypothetical protein ACRDY0_03555 [Acidimicrobiales bacterium]
MKGPAGDWSVGLCGGMVLAAADYWAAGRLPPSTTEAPAPASPLGRYLVRRQCDSLQLPAGALRYLALMHPVVPPAALDALMARRYWPALRSELDAGRLCPLGLVMTRSALPWQAFRHHQVLAWAQRSEGDSVVVSVYDPNRPGDDCVALVRDAAGRVHLDGGGQRQEVIAFLPTSWRPRVPPVDRGTPWR